MPSGDVAEKTKFTDALICKHGTFSTSPTAQTISKRVEDPTVVSRFCTSNIPKQTVQSTAPPKIIAAVYISLIR